MHRQPLRAHGGAAGAGHAAKARGFALPAGAVVEPEMHATLRPKGGVPMRVHLRGAGLRRSRPPARQPEDDLAADHRGPDPGPFELPGVPQGAL